MYACACVCMRVLALTCSCQPPRLHAAPRTAVYIFSVSCSLATTDHPISMLLYQCSYINPPHAPISSPPHDPWRPLIIWGLGLRVWGLGAGGVGFGVCAVGFKGVTFGCFGELGLGYLRDVETRQLRFVSAQCFGVLGLGVLGCWVLGCGL